ncbi:two-component regulator propeller domain-containing protein [Roseateles sp. BYS87W]|uniref:diguanylate cyclase n=1 Tax=Pelomonas baiyunensis TaxID=3299026 RepID=A0ABW7GXU3_9BURK
MFNRLFHLLASLNPVRWRHRLTVAGACLLWAGIATLHAGDAAAAPERRWSNLADVTFQHLGQDQGLPNAIATAVAEDGQGFLWVGTLGGLARWDGYRFKVYKGSPGQPGGLPDNYVQSLFGDAAGRLWVGTSAAGLLRFDPATDRFVPVPVGGAQGLSHVSIRQLLDDGAGGLWVVTDGGLDHLDPSTGRIERASAPGGWAATAGAPVWTALRDRRGQIWLGTAAGLFRRPAAGGPIEAVPLVPGRVVQPLALTEDSAGRIWAGARHEGVFLLGDGGRAGAVAVRESQVAEKDDLLLNSEITRLLEVQPGEMWVSTLGQGAVAVDTATLDTRRLRHVPAWPVSLADNAVRTLYRDRAGQIWVASNRGLSRYDPRQDGVLTRLGVSTDMRDALDSRFLSGEISWILPMPEGRVWLATHVSGVDVLDDTGRRVGGIRPDASAPTAALPPDMVLGMARVPDGSVYIATKRGLYRADAQARSVQRVTLQGRDPTASTWTLLADGATLWVGGQFDGLWRLDWATGRSEPVRPAPPGFTDERIMVLARGEAGPLWVGTRNGLNRFDTASGAVEQFPAGVGQARGLSAGFVTALLPDGRDRLWVGTYGGGIDVVSTAPGGAVQHRIGRPQGLPDATVNALLLDLQGQVWASTDDGLARIDSQSLAVRTFRRAEGVVFPTYWTGSAARTERGDLLFGGSGGMTVVRPERLRSWDQKPTVLVSEVLIGGRPVSPATLGGLEVPAGANSLSVEFASSDFSAPDRNQYAYRLEGYDADWRVAEPSRRLASYANLQPGTYTLRLRASNRDGVWVEQDLRLPVRVQPAWYQTWWFRAALAVALVLALMQVVAMRTRLLQRRQGQLEHKVRERTAELRALHEALQEKSAQLQLSSVTDPLTGLHNRRYLVDQVAPELVVGLRRMQETLAAGGQPAEADTVFLLLDIDGFKRVNDRHGHAAGDTVLVQFGARLRSVLRETDVLVRWGGEEFLAVARGTDRARAEELAERMRTVVAATPFELPDGARMDVTCSVGFACLPFEPERPLARQWQQVVNLADLGLYAAKRSGRNAWVGVHAASGRGARGARVIGGLGLSSSRALDAVQAVIEDAADAELAAG